MEYPYDEDDDFMTVKTADLLEEIKRFIRIIISEDQEQQLDDDSNVAAATQVEDFLKQEEEQNCCICEEQEQFIDPIKIPTYLPNSLEEKKEEDQLDEYSSRNNMVVDESRLTSFLYYCEDYWMWKSVDLSEEEESEPESTEEQFLMRFQAGSFFLCQPHDQFVNPEDQEQECL